MDLHVLVSVRTRVVKQLPAHWDGTTGLGAAPGIERRLEMMLTVKMERR